MTSHQALFDFVFEKLDAAPAAQRILILRALADFAGGEKETKKILALADDLERSERRYREFVFKRTT